MEEPDPCSSGSSENKINNSSQKMEDGFDTDEAWEDQDTEDEDRLTIDEPNKETKTEEGGITIPESILEECRKCISLDKKLDKKAKKNNMNCKQVKLVLKHIFSSPQILGMLRDHGLLTTAGKEGEKIEAAEPKMTRSMTRTLTEAGDPCPWIINPKTPMKEPAPEIVSLVTEDFPEDEGDDPEYTPDLEPRHSDDEDSFLMSENSEAGTPLTNMSRSTVNTPRSELGTPTLLDFKRPRPSSTQGTPRGRMVSRNLQFDQQETTYEGYETRSRRPMTEMNIEDIEQQFIPFDITPDMYDIPCDNDDYAEFLKTLYSGSNNRQSVINECSLDDDLADPEYSFPPDEEDLRLKDPEELRDDRATKISRKELADLMAELLDCANEANQDSEREGKKKGKAKKRKSNHLSPHPTPLPPTQPCKDPEPGPAQGQEDNYKPVVKQREEFSVEQYNQLAAQVQQHIQQVTQLRLLASHNPSFTEVKDQCDMILRQLAQRSFEQPNSVLNQCNLQPSINSVYSWETTGEDPVVIYCFSRDSKNKRRFRYVLKPEFLDFVSDQKIVCFPSLLTGQGLDRLVKKRVVWTPSEDILLAQGLDWIYAQKRMSKVSSFDKTNMHELSVTLKTKRLPAKSVDQIFCRLKNLKRNPRTEHEEDNPIRKFYATGEVPVMPCLHPYPVSEPNTLRSLVMCGERDQIPDVYVERILEPMKEKLRKRPIPIEAKEVVVVEPDIPDFEMDTDQSGSDGTSEEDEPEPKPRRRRAPPKKRIPIMPKPDLIRVRDLTEYPLLLPKTCSAELLKEDETATMNRCSPIRPLLCVDGNETPVSLSESDTPTQPAAPAIVKKSPPVNKSNRTPRPVFTSPVKSKSPLKSPFKSPLKSPLKSLTNNFSRSPLKAASDRIIRKYGSPIKRIGRENRRLGRAAITPKRILSDKGERSSPSTPKNLRSPLNSPREGESDTPTAIGRRKSRVQKETEVTLSLLGNLETEEEKEAREQRETQEMYAAIQAVITEDNSLEQRYDEIISAAGEMGVAQTYVKLNELMAGHPDVQELLLDLLTEEEAASLGADVYNAHADRLRLKRFLMKLAIVYKQQPAYHAKVLKELETLSKDSTLTGEGLKGIACKLFRSNQHLLDEFIMLIPGIQPPQSMMPSPEMFNIPDDCDEIEGLDVETVHVPRSPNSDGNVGNVRFTSGGVFVLDGKNLKPAKIEKIPLAST